jgi:uncharacterized protein (TIGR02246 family)
MAPHDELARLLTAIEAAWNAGDARAYGRLFASDAVYVTRAGVLWQGRPAIEEAQADALAGALAGTTLTLRPTHVAALAPTVVVAQLEVRIASDATVIRAVTTLVLGLESEEWRIVAAHTSDAAPVH